MDILGNNCKCPYCSKSYASSKSLKSHIYRYHRDCRIVETGKTIENLKEDGFKQYFTTENKNNTTNR